MKNVFQKIAKFLVIVVPSIGQGLQAVFSRIDAIDLSVTLIGIGMWLIHPAAAMITVGVILFALGLLHRPGGGR